MSRGPRGVLAGKAVVALVAAASCVPPAELDPCERCPGACRDGSCTPEEIAVVDGRVAGLDAVGGAAFLCVEAETRPTRFLREAGAGLDDLGSAPERCAGVAVDPDGAFAYFATAGAGLFRVRRDGVGPAVRIHGDRRLTGVAARRGTVVVARGELDDAQFAGLRVMGPGGAEIARELAFSDAPGRPPARVRLDAKGGVVWSIGVTEELLAAPSVEADEASVLVDGRGDALRTESLHDFVLVDDEVVVAIDDVLLRFPRDRPWSSTPTLGVPGGARLAADARAIYVAWWGEDRVERIDPDGNRHEVMTGARDALLALTDEHLFIAESAGNRLMRLVR